MKVSELSTCAHIIVHNCRTQHRTVVIIFSDSQK